MEHKNSSTVFFIDNKPLWVTGIEVSNGIISGFVKNGHWPISIDPSKKLTWITGDRGRSPYQELLEVLVPSEVLSNLPKRQDLLPDYDHVIEWARKKIS